MPQVTSSQVRNNKNMDTTLFLYTSLLCVDSFLDLSLSLSLSLSLLGSVGWEDGKVRG